MRRLLSGAVLLAFAAALVPACYAMSPEEASIVAKAAERGSRSSQVLLAVMYLKGDGGYPKDEKQAAYWFEKAAEQGSAYAQLIISDLYEQGRGVEKNLKVAADWREKAADRGNVEAQLKLGKMYLYSEGVAKDLDKAEYWLNRAAVEGNSEAQYLLGRLYRAHGSPKRNPALADNWLAKSAAQGYEDAIRFLHFVESIGYQAEEAFYQRPVDLHQLAMDGDVEAQYQLAMRYESGAGEKKDYDEALRWFKQAAANGHMMAMRSLAHIYAKGLDGVPVDAKAAAYWTDKARAAAK